MKKRVLSLLIAITMLLSLLPAAAFADSQYVYISVSYDDTYVNDKDGGYIAHVPVSFDTLAAVDLNEYGLGEYLYDADGDGTYEITALQLIIYAHENLYGGDFSEVTFTGSPGSSYFAGGLFGRDENLNYYLNGQYPLSGAGWGATSDQIVLKAGDFINLGGFTSWDFYQDSGYGFQFFADASDEITHAYTAEVGTACDIKLIKGSKDAEYNSVFFDVPDFTVHYGPALYQETGTVTTGSDACASITFPSAGKWYLWADGGYGNEYPDSIVSAPAYAEVTVTAEEEPVPEQPREPQDVSAVLNATMAQLAATVTEPVFGTTAGEWTVFGLARGGYFAKDSAYFTDYYNRIVETVNTTAASVNMSGALHKNKSTENSRLIVALSAIGKDATSVGDWDLVEAYSANGFSWIKKQGLNGTIWALIALDSNNYATSDPTIRQQCIDAIVEAQHDDGGWSLMANKTFASDPDITGMALTALYPYRNQAAVAEACGEAFDCLSAIQNDDGTYSSGGAKCSESCSWVIVSTTTWGINPDTDSRFIKNGKSVVDGLLAHYLPDSATFQHIIGAGSNAMATDQSCYGLVAYDRLFSGKTALFDYSDVTFDEPVSDELTATLGLPAKVTAGEDFNASISINRWDNEGGYKLIDFIVTIPEGISVSAVTAGDRLFGGEVSWQLEEETGKLRVVYFDANEHSDLTVSGTEFPAELFTITCKADESVAGSKLPVALSGMSVKLHSDSMAEDAMIVVNNAAAAGEVEVVTGLSFFASVLYQGDDVDLIPADKMAIAVTANGVMNGAKLTYNDGTTQLDLLYSDEITAKSGIATYVVLVDAAMDVAAFANVDNYTVANDEGAAMVNFGDSNSDGVLNAQDALAAVDLWLRKADAPDDVTILTMNVNSDSRINTFDALGIVEQFVDGADFGVVTRAASSGIRQ